MRGTWTLATTLLLVMARPATSLGGWVLPSDHNVCHGFSCWPAVTVNFRPPANDQPAAAAALPREEEQEIVLAQFVEPAQQPIQEANDPLQEMGSLAPRSEEPAPAKGPTLAEIAAMSNNTHVIVQGIFQHEPPPSRRSCQEVWLDCQDRLGKGVGGFGSGVSSFWRRLAGHANGCPCPE